MKSKTLLPLIWLLLIPVPMSYTQTPPESPEEQSSGYGIEPDTLYPGLIVLEILAAAEAEIDQVVEEAYEEGYKAASLRYAPDTAYYTALSESIKRELEAERKKPTWFLPSIVIAGSLSLLGGFLIHAVIAR